MEWHKVKDATENAQLVAWDGCHKIYVAMDEVEARWFNEREDYLKFRGTPEEMFARLEEWYDRSCGLRFISGVESVGQETEFTKLIPQL